MNKLLFTSIFMISTSLFSQRLFFTTGKNYTDYDFKMSLNTQNKEFSSGSGNFHEVGYIIVTLDNSTNGFTTNYYRILFFRL